MRLTVALLLAAACESTAPPPGIHDVVDQYVDHAPPYVGAWLQPADVFGAPPKQLIVTRAGFDRIAIAGVCDDGSGPVIPVTSSASFKLDSFDCAPQATSDCAAASVHFDTNWGGLSTSWKGTQLWLTLSGTATGCSSQRAFTLSFTGASSGEGALVATIAGAPRDAVPVGTRVALHGDGAPAAASSFAWTLQGPNGSAAALAATSAADTSFAPDLPGDYHVSLVAGGASLPSTIGVRAVNAGPQIAATVPTAAVLGAIAALDASATSASSYAWTLTSRPGTSQAALANSATAVATLIPDVEGIYTLRLDAEAAGARSSATFSLTAYRPVPMLAFHVVDAGYSRALDRVIAVSADALHLVDAASLADTAVPLASPPTCVTVSSDGLFALVGHGAEVTYVDLANASVLARWPIPSSAFDVALGDPLTSGTRFGYVAVFGDLYAIDLSSGATTRTARPAAQHLALEPGGHALLTVSYGALSRYPLGDDGLTTQFAFWNISADDVFYAHDGATLLTAYGDLLRTSDMTKLAHFSLYRSPGADEASGRWIAADVEPYLWTQDGTLPLPRVVSAGAAFNLYGRYAFFDSSAQRRIAIGEAESAARLTDDDTIVSF